MVQGAVLPLLVAGGRAQLIPGLCRRWRPMVERGNGCLEEYWTAGPGLGSRCHAWSATPTYDLSTHVLGIRPAAPGWERIEIVPELGDLDWAEGEVPTPFGPVRARFGDRAWVEIPDGVTASVRYAGQVRDCGPGRTEL